MDTLHLPKESRKMHPHDPMSLPDEEKVSKDPGCTGQPAKGKERCEVLYHFKSSFK